MSQELSLCILEFTYKKCAPLALSLGDLPIWHSVFGKALHQRNCLLPDTACFVEKKNETTEKDCPFLHSCHYPYLFDRVASDDSEMMRGQKIPVPHVFRFKTTPSPNQTTLSVALVIIGKAIDKYDSIIQTMKQAGLSGLGKQRQKLKLTKVTENNIEESVKTIWENNQLIATPQATMVNAPPCPTAVQIIFETPYKTKTRSAFKTDELLMGVIRRISLLQYFYTGKCLHVDFKYLKEQTIQTKTLKQTLRWQQNKRYSTRLGATVDTSGWVGQITVTNPNLRELWPYLWIGQWLGIGKNASMGFGQYRLENSAANLQHNLQQIPRDKLSQNKQHEI